MIYTVTFNPAIDYVVHLENFQVGSINRVTSEDIQFGGKGINVSNVLKNLGIDSVVLGFIAGFTGEAIEKAVTDKGIHTDFIHLKEGNTRINVKIKGEKETEINASGPAIPQSAIDKLFKKLEVITEGDILVLAGSIPNTLPGDIYEKIMSHLNDKGILVVVDATKDLLCNVLKYHPFLIKPNNYELGEIFGLELNTDEEICIYAKKLQEMGAKNVLVSMASKGAILLDEYGTFHKIGVPKGVVKNSVGAGDSMVAGFLTGYCIKKDYSYALRMGTATGSATAFSETLATYEEVMELLNIL